MSAERPSGDVGTRLREARARRGVSLRQIANATKISVAVLEALERNDISKLPGGIFSRAFVRAYAIEVGLDPEAAIQEFISQFPGDAVTAGHPHAGPAEDGGAFDSDRRTATAFLRLIAVSVPIAAGVLYFSTAGRSVRPPATAAPPPLAAPAREPAPPVATPAAPASPESAEATSGTAQPAIAPAKGAPEPASAPASADRLLVELTATRPCWVSAMADGQKSIERLLRAGEHHTIEVHRDLVLTAGDASAITLTLNGADARPLGKTGDVVTVRLNLANFKDYLLVR